VAPVNRFVITITIELQQYFCDDVYWVREKEGMQKVGQNIQAGVQLARLLY
jgi:hypothetical protein